MKNATIITNLEDLKRFEVRAEEAGYTVIERKFVKGISNETVLKIVYYLNDEE